jgi:hypothetical protein
LMAGCAAPQCQRPAAVPRAAPPSSEFRSLISCAGCVGDVLLMASVAPAAPNVVKRRIAGNGNDRGPEEIPRAST